MALIQTLWRPRGRLSSRLTFGLPRGDHVSISKPNHPTVRSLLHTMMFRCLYPGEFSSPAQTVPESYYPGFLLTGKEVAAEESRPLALWVGI